MELSNKENKINDKLLLDALIKYIIPSFNKSPKEKKRSKLEELVREEKPKLKPLETIFLEELISLVVKKKEDIKIKNTQKPDFSELIEFEKDNKADFNDEFEIKYSIERRKEKRDDFTYSVSIKYEENQNEEKLSVKVDDYQRNNNFPLNNNPIENNSLIKNNNNPNENKLSENKKQYEFEIIKEKNNETKRNGNYSISLVYENNYEQERLSVNYKSTIGAYLNKRQEALHDFTDRVPGKHLHILPESVMGGILGFTYLGENFMARRADLTGDKAKMVDIHESIHTPNEYETRILTDWIMAKQIPKYIK